MPRQWATTQNNLGGALTKLGAILGEPESTARLEEAVAAYRNALEEQSREHVPFHWAATQNNLGHALRMLGARETGTARLEQARIAFGMALDVFEKLGADYPASNARQSLQSVGSMLPEQHWQDRGPFGGQTENPLSSDKTTA